MRHPQSPQWLGRSCTHNAFSHFLSTKHLLPLGPCEVAAHRSPFAGPHGRAPPVTQLCTVLRPEGLLAGTGLLHASSTLSCTWGGLHCSPKDTDSPQSRHRPRVSRREEQRSDHPTGGRGRGRCLEPASRAAPTHVAGSAHGLLPAGKPDFTRRQRAPSLSLWPSNLKLSQCRDPRTQCDVPGFQKQNSELT